MKYLVTGGAGYIGSIVARMLIEQHHDVSIIDNGVTGDLTAVPDGATLHQLDITDTARILDNSFDGVFHFAGLIAAGESMIEPDKYWLTNTEGTAALLRAMRHAGVNRLVFSSTAAVYGNPIELPITEDAVPAPTNTYGATKLAADEMISSFANAYGLAAVSLRYFNVAGAWRDTTGTWLGERHEPETHLIPLALTAAATGNAIRLFGDDYDTSDGTCVRDYIHVADLARAHLLAIDTATPGTHSIYNLGNGVGFSNQTVIDTVATVTGQSIDVAIAPRRSGDPAALVASSGRALDELGWRPRHTALSDIISDAWEFYRHG